MIRKYGKGTIVATGKDANTLANALFAPYQVEDFNAAYQPGDKVLVLDDFGQEFIDEVTAPASILPSGTAVAWLKGKGSYNIRRVIAKASQQFMPVVVMDEPAALPKEEAKRRISEIY